MTSPARPWLRSPVFDVALLAYCWVPVYLWLIFGLGLGDSSRAHNEALSSAIVLVLGLTYVHRHYTFVLVYGHGATFRDRARSYVLAPLIVFGLAAFALSFAEPIRIGEFRVPAFGLMLLASGLWNVWHTVQQRYGILRAYAGKARGGLEAPAHGRRDRTLLWTLVLALVVVLPWANPETFGTHSAARRVLGAVSPVVEHEAYVALVALAAIACVGVGAWWWRTERLARVDRGPRWIFLSSTLMLLGVFVVHGPIIGYLCFGAAHALEYVAFVHHFAERRFEGEERRSIASVFLGRPLVFAPILITAFGLLYLVTRTDQTSDVYLAYYVGTSMLHFLYDGWIWKLRRPEVGRPLGV